MANKIRRVAYYNTTVHDRPGEAYQLLSSLADLGINLLAFTSIPIGPDQTQLTLFPEDGSKLATEAKKAKLPLIGPNHAILVTGDDELGALSDVHNTLYKAKVNVYASSGVGDGEGGYGYLIYVRPEDFERAAKALGI
jgi:hypothetical protein